MGLWLLKDLLAVIPEIVASIFFIKQSYDQPWSYIGIMIPIFVYVILFYLLVFRTDIVIDRLHLSKGFDAGTLPLTIHHSTVLSIAVIVIGGWLCVNEIPNFFKLLFLWIEEKKNAYIERSPIKARLFVTLIKIIIGIFLMVGQKQIVLSIERYRRR
jgi:hypothetical protein